MCAIIAWTTDDVQCVGIKRETIVHMSHHPRHQRQSSKAGDVVLWRGINWVNNWATIHRWLPQGAQVVVLSALQHLHLSCWIAGGASVAGICLYMLPQGARIGTKWSQAEGTKSLKGQARIWRDFYDRSKGLGWWTHFWTNNNWANFGELLFFFFNFYLMANA